METKSKYAFSMMNKSIKPRLYEEGESMGVLTRRIFRIFSSSRVGRAILQVVTSIGFTFKTKRLSRIFYDGAWVHQNPTRTFVDTRINWNLKEKVVIAETYDYCLLYYTPKTGDVILDVGAGVGRDTFIFSSEVGESGKVVAVEAHPTTFMCLSKMCEYNKLKNVTALNLAVTDKESRVIIEDSKDNPVDNRLINDETKGIPVNSKSVDQIVNELGITHIDFLKMNIEGAEKLAIKGMTDTIKRTRQVCIACHDFLAEPYNDMEMNTKQPVIDFLKKNGFKVFTREDDPVAWLSYCVYGINTAEENKNSLN